MSYAPIRINSHAPSFVGHREAWKRIQGVKDSRIQVKGVEVKPLKPSNPRILEPYFRIKPPCPA